MMWRAPSRSVALRLLLLAAITAAGPAGAASWHLIDQRGGHQSVGPAQTTPVLDASSPSGSTGEHCAICQFGAAVRAFLPSPVPGVATPSHDLAVHRAASLTYPDDPTATGHSGRAPPRAV